jgi:hypothetical protein
VLATTGATNLEREIVRLFEKKIMFERLNPALPRTIGSDLVVVYTLNDEPVGVVPEPQHRYPVKLLACCSSSVL